MDPELPKSRRDRRSHPIFRLLFLLPLAGCHHRPELSNPGEPLRPCPGTPNCVSTEATDRRHGMAPLPFTGPAAGAQARARAALLREPRTRIVAEHPGYLRAESRSRMLGFVDDVEVVVDDAAKVIRFRSASRVGRSDFGVNRARMERFGRRFGQVAGADPRSTVPGP